MLTVMAPTPGEATLTALPVAVLHVAAGAVVVRPGGGVPRTGPALVAGGRLPAGAVRAPGAGEPEPPGVPGASAGAPLEPGSPVVPGWLVAPASVAGDVVAYFW